MKCSTLFSFVALSFFGSGFSVQAFAAETKAEPKHNTLFEDSINFKVEKFKLDNGLTVLLSEDHSAPIISYHTWFRVGSKNEEANFTGIAHLFEHMMFKGAKRYSGDEFETVLQSNGANNNAFTSNDYTGYYENLPSSKLELAMDVESDRMESLQVTAENLKSEREVVKEERRMRVDNSPMGVLSEVLFGNVYHVHPYHWPVIGYMKDIDNITLEKAQEFHKTYYAPNNAVVVIAGDFSSDQAKALLNKYYGGLKSQDIPVLKTTAEPKQTAPRMQLVPKPVQNATVAVAYLVPRSGSEESYALDLLANMLGHGPSSRMYKRLVYKDQIATGVSVGNSTMQEGGMFEIFASLKPGVSYRDASRKIFAEMWRPSHLGITKSELEKAKKQVMKSYVDGLKTIFGKAEALAANEIIFGDYAQLFKDLPKYDAVTLDDVKKAADKYLQPSRSSLCAITPEPTHAKKKKGAKT